MRYTPLPLALKSIKDPLVNARLFSRQQHLMGCIEELFALLNKAQLAEYYGMTEKSHLELSKAEEPVVRHWAVTALGAD